MPIPRWFTLRSKRAITLESLKQWTVYSGLLEGYPTRERNDAEIQRLVADAVVAMGMTRS